MKTQRTPIELDRLPVAVNLETFHAGPILVFFDGPLLVKDGSCDDWGALIRRRPAAGTPTVDFDVPPGNATWGVTSGDLNRVRIDNPSPTIITPDTDTRVQYDPALCLPEDRILAADGREVAAFDLTIPP